MINIADNLFNSVGILWSIPWWSIWGPFLGQFVDGIQLVTTHLPKVAKPLHTHLLSVTWLPGKELVSSTHNKVFTWHIVQSCSNRRIDQSSWVAIGRIHPNRLEVHWTAGAASFGHLSHVRHGLAWHGMAQHGMACTAQVAGCRM